MKALKKNDRGVTLIETMIAVLIALIGVFSLGAVIFQATVTNQNQGSEVTRSTIYAQDKIEKMLSLGAAGGISTTSANFATCTQSASSQPAACNSTGITGTGWTTGLLQGGLISPIQATCPTSGSTIGYVDFLDASGNQLTATSCTGITASNIGYVRMWSIKALASTGGPTIKQVTVAVYSMIAVGGVGVTQAVKPVVMLTSLLSNPN